MKKLTTLLGVLIGLTVAGSAFAIPYGYPPGPSYRTCPDTLTLYDLQNPDSTLAPCHPVIGDTAKQVGGIVIGFDARSGAFAVYYMNSAGGPYSGLDAFTGATNYISTPYNLAIGDSIKVTGTMQEFPATDGETEIEGPDVVQTTNDIIINKISSGNPFPKIFRTTNPNDLNWIPLAAGNQAEKYEGTFVRVVGPLVVRRINTTAGTIAGLPGTAFLATTPSGSDSIAVDGFTLVNPAVGPPPVGTVIDSLQGIPNQRTSGGVNSYRIQVRNGNDIFVAAPPNLSDAYPLEDNQLRLVFDRNVDVTTAEDEGNYSLGSGIDGSTVDLAVVEGGSGNKVLLTITSVRIDGDAETVSALGIASETCPTCIMSPQQTRSFVNGVLDIPTVQAADPSMLSLFDDRSPFAGTGTLPGTRLTVRGVSTGVYGSLYYMQEDGSGAAVGPLRSGISIFGPSAPLTPGRKYRVVGQVQEFGNETEIVQTVEVTDEGVAGAQQVPVFASGRTNDINALEPPLLGDIGVLADTTTDMTGDLLTGEDYEGMLVQLDRVWITENRTVGQSFFVTGHCCYGGPGTGDTLLVSNLNGVLNAYDSPDSMSVMNIVGILHFTNGTFRLCPRSAADITNYGILDVNGGGSLSLALKVSPNPARIANVTFALPSKGNVDVSVFDLAGRKITTVAKGSFDAGTYTRRWDGTDRAGNRVPAGVYFYSYKVGSQELRTRGVILN